MTDSLPSVVIVGRPNVGKSTLFNALTGTRRSIVGDEPGITRDRIYGQATHRGRHFQVIDTGGIVPNDQEFIPTEILKQARVALENAAQIIFVVNGKNEITSADRDLGRLLRRLGKPLTLAVNKIDAPSNTVLVGEFYSLGIGEVLPVSAEHKLGLRELLDHVTRDFPAAPEEQPNLEDQPDGEEPKAAVPWTEQARPIKVAIVGRPNAGKSTLLNALAGEERAIVSDVAGTTRDAVDEKVVHEGREYVFVDTAGIRRKGKTKLMAEKLSVVMARRHIRMSHVCLLIVDATEGVLGLDATIAGYAHEDGRAVIICVNKWDASPEPSQARFAQSLRDELKFLEYAPIVFLSAKTGAGVGRLFPDIQKGYDSASQRVTTGELNRFVEMLAFESDIKIKYITQTDIRPPTFILFTARAAQRDLHFSEERFLINQLRRRFGFAGTPLRIKLRMRERR